MRITQLYFRLNCVLCVLNCFLLIFYCYLIFIIWCRYTRVVKFKPKCLMFVSKKEHDRKCNEIYSKF